MVAILAETVGNLDSVRLTTWKQIAAFVRRDERTVKRWEETRGLPVYRLPGTGRASIYAYTHELQAWLDGAPETPDEAAATPAAPPERPARRFGPRHLAVAGLLLAAGLAAAVALFRFLPGEFAGGNSDAVRTHDLAAAEYYRSGLHEWQTRTPAGLKRALSDFGNAVRRDPDFAQAYVGLANTYNLMREFTLMPASEAYPRAVDAATRAVALDPSLAGAHAALAFADFYWRRDVAGAYREFARAIALEPDNATAHHWYATFLMTVGSFRAARAEIETAARLDPESAAILADKGLILFYAGEPDAARRLLEQLESDQPLFTSPHFYLSAIALMRGDDREYLREMKLQAATLHDADETALSDAAGKALAAGGRPGMLREILARRVALYARGKGTAYALAQDYALVGDRKNALAFLEVSLSRQEPEIVGMKINPLLAGLRDAPEFGRILQRAGLTSRA